MYAQKSQTIKHLPKQPAPFKTASPVLSLALSLALSLVLGTALALPGIATADEIPARVEDKKSKAQGVDPERMQKLTDFLQAEVARENMPNGSVYIWRHGKLAWSAEVGYSDLASKKVIRNNSIYRMFSMTKPMTAAAVMLLVDDGKVLLNDPISLYLPEFANMQVMVPVPPAPGSEPKNPPETVLVPATSPIRIRDLLTHTDGFTYNFIPSPLAPDYTALGIEPGNPQPTEGRNQPSLSAMVKDLATLPLMHQPGASWHYGVGLDVAGRLVEVVANEDFRTFMRERLIEPLDMKDTDFFLQPRVARKRLTTLYNRNPGELEMTVADNPNETAWGSLPAIVSGGGGLVGTASDYMNFATMLLNLGRHNGQQILSQRAVEVMMSNNLSPIYGTAPDIWIGTALGNYNSTLSGIGYGLGGAVYTDYGLSDMPLSPGSYTWGGAAGTRFWVDPVKNMAVIFTSQLIELGPGPFDQTIDRVANLVYQGLID